jgi:transcription initiation factor TFIID subunit 6
MASNPAPAGSGGGASIITAKQVQAVAHSLDITRLTDEAARLLAPDVEYRLREVIQVSVSAQTRGVGARVVATAPR